MVDARPARQIEEAVQAEPQRRVAHHVVGHPVGGRVEVEEANPQTVGLGDALPGRFTIGVRQCRRDPESVSAGHKWGETGHESARAPPGHQAPAVVLERHRAPVRHDHD